MIGVNQVSATEPESPGSQTGTRPTTTSPTTTQPTIVDFQPGIRLDWVRRQVEDQATVILREGFLELLACSPRIREHESIVRIEARPTTCTWPWALIGLTPGRPAWYDPQTERSGPATGDAVEIDVRYPTPQGPRTVPLEDWARPADGHEPLGRLPWVFAGSVPWGDGSIAADVEGTVVAVVDFSTSLIALPEHHSDRNEELWLAPRTEAIPPVGTACTLIFRPGPLRISLDATGRLTVGGERMTLGALAGRLGRAPEEDPSVRLGLLIDPQSPQSDEKQLLGLLERLGWTGSRMAIERRAVRGLPEHNPAALATWLSRTRRPSPSTQPENHSGTSWPADRAHDR
jgi:hypothetical protein